jgi:hypothetical protein
MTAPFLTPTEKTCLSCGEPKPATLAHYSSQGRKADGTHQLRSRCRECRGKGKNVQGVRKHFVSAVPGAPAYIPGPKPCVNCHDMPWRVDGMRCACCGLAWAKEPKPELQLRRFDRVG